MSITSVLFICFVLISIFIYYLLKGNGQWILLLIDSIVFYVLSAKPITLIYVAYTVASVYCATAFFDKVSNKKKKVLLAAVLLSNVAILAVLKYSNLGIHSVNGLLKIFRVEKAFAEVEYLAPLALSFYMLQMLSYLLDCYWGVAIPEKNIAKLTLYTIYFPLMVSGPICRHSQIGNSLFDKHEFDYNRVVCGLRRIAFGLIKKMAIADRLAVIVNVIYGDIDTYSGIWFWLGAFIFIFQLYLDFSGCMDIVIGASQCFGIILPENFNHPFTATNIQEFWQRWHITLGTWLKDYIMNPILRTRLCMKIGEISKARFGKKKGKKIPSYFAMFFVWTCMGIWHGNSWKYIIGEGWWFWIIIVVGQILEPTLLKIKEILHIKECSAWTLFQRVRTFVIFAVGMVFFRADSLSQGFRMLKRGVTGLVSSLKPSYIIDIILPKMDQDNLIKGMGGKFSFVVMMISIIFVLIIENMQSRNTDIDEWIGTRKNITRWVMYGTEILIIIISYLISYGAVATTFMYGAF